MTVLTRNRRGLFRLIFCIIVTLKLKGIISSFAVCLVLIQMVQPEKALPVINLRNIEKTSFNYTVDL